MATPLPFPRSRKRSGNLAQTVAADLTQRIRGGQFRPGDKLPTETELIEEQGVSRTVVREALSQLQAAGLVETRHGIGTFVLAMLPDQVLPLDPGTLVTLRDVIALLELRIGLETEAASLAAVRRTDMPLQAMRQALDALQAGIDAGGDTAAADFQFHRQIAQATDNRHFADLFNHLGAALIPRTRLDTPRLTPVRDGQYLQRINHEHEDIYAAIARQDSDAARAAMRMHLTNSRERLRRAADVAEAPPS